MIESVSEKDNTIMGSSTLLCLFAALILFLHAVESNNPKSDQVSGFTRLFNPLPKLTNVLLIKGFVGACSGVPGIRVTVIFVSRESVCNTFIIQQHWNQQEVSYNLSGSMVLTS